MLADIIGCDPEQISVGNTSPTYLQGINNPRG
jgi:hypothetical protein